MEAYCKDIKSYRTLTLAEEQELARQMRNGDKRAFQALIQANLKFVVALCQNYAGQGLPFQDLINEGNLGLIRAAHRFDASMNFKFISYAVWWIRQGILTALAGQGRPLSVTTDWTANHRALNLATRKLEQALHPAPSEEELAAETGKSVAAILRCRRVSAPTISLNKTYHGEGGREFGDGLEDVKAKRADEGATRHLLGKRVEEMLHGLEKREGDVLRLYFGIGCEACSNLADIGRHLNLTRERIRQIKAKALRKLGRTTSKPALSNI